MLCEAQGDVVQGAEMRKAFNDSGRGDVARRRGERGAGDPTRHSCAAVGLLRRVTGPASTRCNVRRSLAQSVAPRCVKLRGYYVVSGLSPVEDVKDCICGLCDASSASSSSAIAERSHTDVHQCL